MIWFDFSNVDNFIGKDGWNQYRLKKFINQLTLGKFLGNKRVILAYQQPAGTAGGTATTGAFTTYPINTILQNDLSIAAISSNTWILPAGTYYLERGWLEQGGTGNFTCRLFNITDSTTILTGSLNAAPSQTFWVFTELNYGTFTIPAGKVIAFQYYSTSTAGIGDLGPGTNGSGQANTFGLISFVKIG